MRVHKALGGKSIVGAAVDHRQGAQIKNPKPYLTSSLSVLAPKSLVHFLACFGCRDLVFGLNSGRNDQKGQDQRDTLSDVDD